MLKCLSAEDVLRSSACVSGLFRYKARHSQLEAKRFLSSNPLNEKQGGGRNVWSRLGPFALGEGRGVG